VRQVGEIIGQIDAGNSEQSQGMLGMQQAIVSMDEITQQNLALVQQAAAAASTLQRQALYLSEAVAIFKLDENIEPPDATRPAGSHRIVRLRLASVRT
jgi:methyl-accepting chemotaxis protein